MSKTNERFPNVTEWLGIPFAKAGRFEKPVLLPFDKNLPYCTKGAAPFQDGGTSWLETESGISEDCLNLNVWAPKEHTEKPLPVVVYVFGGGWTSGANCQTVCDASGLAATGRAIGVSINYRLGAFGWLQFAQFGGKLKDATNLGLQDIIAALKWVQENIRYFGGDPDNVTLTGHSAGAFSILSLLGVPAADGLYHHIAAFSGMPSRLVPGWGAEERTQEVLRILQCEDDPEKLFDIDAAALARAMSQTVDADPGVQHGVDNKVIAVTDDSYLPNGLIAMHPMDALKSGRRKEVDILFSSTSQETYWWVLHKTKYFDPGTIESLTADYAHANRIPLSRARKIIAAFNVDGRKPVEVRGDLLTNFSFTLPQTRGAIAHAAAGGKAYLQHIGPVKGAEYAVHGTEMYGIVGQVDPDAGTEQVCRDNMVRDAVLDLAEGKNLAWEPVADDVLSVRGLGDLPYDAETHAKKILEIFDGIARP